MPLEQNNYEDVVQSNVGTPLFVPEMPIDENLPLLSVTKRKPNDPVLKKLAARIDSLFKKYQKKLTTMTQKEKAEAAGHLVICIALYSQYLLGAFTADQVVRAFNIAEGVGGKTGKVLDAVTRIIVDLGVGYGAFIGKLAVIWRYGKDNFGALAHPVERAKNVFNVKEWNAIHWITLLLGVPIVFATAFGFAELTPLASQEIAAILKRDFDWGPTNWLSEKIFLNRYVSIPSEAASFFSNALGLGYVVKGSVERVFNFFYFFAQNPSFRAETEKLYVGIESSRLEWKKCIEQKNYGKIKEFINALLDPADQLDENSTLDNVADIISKIDKKVPNAEELSKEELAEKQSELKVALLKKILAISKDYTAKDKAKSRGLGESGLEFMVANGLAVTAAYGLNNFIPLTRIMCQKDHLDAVQEEMAMADYAGMAMLAWGIYPFVAHLTSRLLFGREPGLKTISNKEHAKIIVKTAGWCAIGVTPNVAQSIIAKQNPTEWVFAALASFLIEQEAFYKNAMDAANAAVTKNDPLMLLGVKIDAILQEARKIETLTPDQVYELCNYVQSLQNNNNSNTHSVNSQTTPPYWAAVVKNKLSNCFAGFFNTRNNSRLNVQSENFDQQSLRSIPSLGSIV